MTTPKSSFKKNRRMGWLRSALQQQSAFAIATAILLFITIAVPYMVAAPDHSYLTLSYTGPDLTGAIRDYYTRAFSGIYLSEAQPGFIGVFLALISFAGALSSTRYLHSKKMTDLYHSLPLRREKLLLEGMGATMTAILTPFLLTYLLTMAWQQLAYGRYGWVSAAYFRYIAMDLLLTIVLVWVVYALTTFVAVNVGTTFDALAIAGTLMFLPTALYGIGGAIWDITSFGADFQGEYALRLSPFLFFFERFTSSVFYGTRSPAFQYSYLAALMTVWFLIGCLLFGLALFCYRRRKSEIAEQTQPSGLFQMVVKCFAVFCGAALFLGLFHDRPMAVRLLALVLGGAGIGLIAELILSRGIRSMLKNLRWLALAGAVYGLLYLGLTVDLFGYERRIPALSNVASVTVSYRGQYDDDISLNDFLPYVDWRYHGATTLEDLACIEMVREAHLSLLEHRRQEDIPSYSSENLRIEYQLKKGGTLRRYYSNADSQSYALLSRLEEQPEFIAKNSPLFFMDEYAHLSGVHHLSVTASASSVVSAAPRPLELDRENLNRLIAALQSDTLRQPLEEILHPAQQARGYIRLTYRDYTRLDGDRYDLPAATKEYPMPMYSDDSAYDPSIVSQHWVPLTNGYTQTLALLRELNLEELLTPDLAGVSEARITDLYQVYRYYNADRVRRIMPAGPDSFYWRLQETEDPDTRIFSVSDPAELEALISRGKSRMFLDREQAARVMALQYFDQSGRGMAMQLIRLEDLPDPVRAQAVRYLETLYPSDKFTFATEVTMIAH